MMSYRMDTNKQLLNWLNKLSKTSSKMPVKISVMIFIVIIGFVVYTPRLGGAKKKHWNFYVEIQVNHWRDYLSRARREKFGYDHCDRNWHREPLHILFYDTESMYSLVSTYYNHWRYISKGKKILWDIICGRRCGWKYEYIPLSLVLPIQRMMLRRSFFF